MVESNTIYAPKTQLYLSGTQGLSAPLSSSTVPDVDVRVLLQVGTLPNVNAYTLVARYDAASSSRDFQFYIEGNVLKFLRWNSIQASTNWVSSVALDTFLSTERLIWVRALQYSNGDCEFYYKDPLNIEWTLLSTHSGSYRAPFSNSANLTIGGDQNAATSRAYVGSIAKVELYSITDGSLVAEADFSYPWTNNKYRDKTGKIWTINGSAWAWEYQNDPEDRYA